MIKKRSPGPPRPVKSKKKERRVGRGKIPGAAAGDGAAKKRKNVEEALRDSERIFTKVFRDNAAAIVLTRLRDGIILDVNQKWEEIFGYSRDEVVGKTAADDFVVWRHPEDRQRAISDLEKQGSLHNREFEFVRKNGDVWTALMSAEVIRLRGEPVNLVSLVDITEQRRIAEENRSLARFPSENPNPVLRLSPAGAILFANEASKPLLESRKRAGAGFVPEKLREAVSRAFIDRSPKTEEIECEDRTYSLHIVPIEGAGYVNMYGRDVTGEKRAEASLRRNEMRFRALFDKMSEGSALHEIVCDEKGVPVDYRFLEINPAFEQLTGLKRADIIGKLQTDILPGDDPEWVRIYGQVALSGEPVHFENYSPALKRHYDVYAYCPAPGQFAVLFTDISEHRKKEEELRRLNRMLKAHSHSTHSMMHATDESAYLQEICRIIVEDCGHALVWIGHAEDDEEKSVRVLAYAGFEASYLETLRLTWADSERGRGPTGTAIRTGKPVICRNMKTESCFEPWREDAMNRGFAASIAIPLRAEGKSFGALTIYSRDVDPFSPDEVKLLTELTDDLAYGIKTLRLRLEHARAEAALDVSLTKYRVLFDSFPLGISIADKDGKLIESNREAERLLELTKEEHEKRTVDSKDWRLIRADGTPMPESEFASVRALKENRLVENVEMGIVKGAGDVTWINVTAAPIPLEEFGLAITYGDITERSGWRKRCRKAAITWRNC
jgi:PAS domain S-box-containing protein